MVEARAQVMNDLSGKNAKPQWDRSAKMIVKRFLKRLVLVIGDDWMEALLKEGPDLPVEVTDTLVGPLELFSDAIQRVRHL
jgi:hypothetical protein